MENPTPGKRQLSETQLRALAEGRKKSFETRGMKKEVNQAKKVEKKEKLKQEYEELVLKKKKQPEPEKPAEDAETQSDSESETESQNVPLKEETPNYKQLYYKHKLTLLEQQQQEQQFIKQYQRAPSHVHAADIAKATLKQRGNEAILKQVMRDIFHD